MLLLFLEQYKRSHLLQVICIIFNEIYRRVTRILVRNQILFFLFYTMYAVKVGNSSIICLGFVSDPSK